MRVTAWQIKRDPKNRILNLTPARLHHLRCWSKGRKTSCKVSPPKISADFSSSLTHCDQPLPALHRSLSTRLHQWISSHPITPLEEMDSGQGFTWFWLFSVFLSADFLFRPLSSLIWFSVQNEYYRINILVLLPCCIKAATTCFTSANVHFIAIGCGTSQLQHRPTHVTAMYLGVCSLAQEWIRRVQIHEHCAPQDRKSVV